MKRSDEAAIIERDWATTPFPVNSKLEMPVYNFITGEFSGKNVILDHAYFNQPL